MPRFGVAHIHEQGQDLVIIPLDPSFDLKCDSEKAAIMADFQIRASTAGLKGLVVLAWERFGRAEFLGPREWSGFPESISLEFVFANVNRKLSW